MNNLTTVVKSIKFSNLKGETVVTSMGDVPRLTGEIVKAEVTLNKKDIEYINSRKIRTDISIYIIPLMYKKAQYNYKRENETTIIFTPAAPGDAVWDIEDLGE